MHMVKLNLDGDECWPDLRSRDITHGMFQEVAYLPHGTLEGNPVVMVRALLDDGRTVLIETTAKMFVTLAAGIKGRGQKDGIDI